jgi:hypothetical protein
MGILWVNCQSVFSSALAQALEDYEKRKAAGEIPEVEEEDIYATAAETAVCTVTLHSFPPCILPQKCMLPVPNKLSTRIFDLHLTG